MQNILFLISGIALGIWVKSYSTKKTKTGQVETFASKSSEEMEEIQEEAKEVLSERTEERKGKIMEFMRNEITHQKELSACNLEGSPSNSSGRYQNKQGIICSDIEKLLEVSGATARKYLNELEDENKVKQVGERGKGVYYELI